MTNLELLKNRLSYGTASALIAAMGFIGAPAASAQDGASADDEEVEEVVVTGSRLRRSSLTSKTPLAVIDAAEFENRGFTNVIQALNDNTFFNGNGTSAGANGQNGDNFSFGNVLGLGTERTVTLVNGRRFVITNQNTVFVPGNNTGAQVDLSIIPTTAIERTEVNIASGGAVYGADAVGGVVNVLLKDDFEGLETVAQFGITDRGDGESYLFSATYGQNFDNDRGNFTVSAEYFFEDGITGDQRSFIANNPALLTNPLNGDIRNTDPFSASAAAATLAGGGTIPGAFLPLGADGAPSSVQVFNLVNPTQTFGGALAGGFGGFSGIATPIENGLVSGATAGAAADPAGFAFFAPSSLPTGVDPLAVIASLAPGTATTGLSAGQLNSLALGLLQRNRPTPAEFFAANPGLDPNLFVGTFGDTDAFPRIANTDPATSALFPFIAVPLQFNGAGELVALNVGDRDPAFSDINSVIGGDGVAFDGTTTNIRSSTERASVYANGKYDLRDNITVYGDFLYSFTRFESVGAPGGNVATGSTAAGSGRLAIFLDDNPFVSQQARDLVTQLEADGFTGVASQATSTLFGSPLPGRDPSRVIAVNRNNRDIFGGTDDSFNESQTVQATIGLRGDFEFADRNFYWDTNFIYGRTDTTNGGEQRRDIEFFLALDAVEDDNGNIVCRQQITGPQPIDTNNAFLSGLTNLVGLTPTQAQVDACVPLNVFGEGSPSPEAIANIVDFFTTENVTELYYVSGQFGGDVIDVPAGTITFNTQIEYRRESNDFVPSFEVANALGGNANTPGADGVVEFVEGGAEVSIPVFGGDFTLPGFKLLEFEGAFRVVSRTQGTQSELFADVLDDVSGVTDEIFEIRGTWRPFDDLTINANYSESVRSPSATQLFGALQFAFSNGNIAFPCDATGVVQGPNPAVRAANCATLFTALGATDPQNFASTFQNISVGETAGVVGNPFLSNEQAEAFSVNAVYQPSWLHDSVYIGVRWTAIDIDNQVGLNGPATTFPACFDSPDFPNVDLNGTNPCDQFIFGVENSDGIFIVPNPPISQITGNPILVGPAAGDTLNGQGFGQVAFSFFSNLNLATTELRQLTLTGGFALELEEILGSGASGWGRIKADTQIQYIDRFDVFSDGTPNTLNPQAGDTFSRWSARFDLDYAVGKFGALLQFFHDSGTVGNVLTPADTFVEQGATFVTPDFNRFNANLRYQVTDNVTAFLTVNNVFDNNGVNINDGIGVTQFIQANIGRSYSLRLSARF